MSHVFISYKHNDEDRGFIRELRQQLNEAGFEVWIDEKIPSGRKWRDEIDEKLRESFAVALVVTPEAMESQYINYEWIFALGAGADVIPIYLRPVESLPYRLEDIQYIDFRERYSWGKLIQQLQKIKTQSDVPLVVQEAVAALNRPGSNERKAAIESLAQTRHPEAHNALIAATEHPTQDVRIEAATKLIALEDFDNVTALPALIEAYPNAALHHRVAILNMITRHQYKDGMSVVLKGLREDQPATEQAAFKALEQIIDERAVRELLTIFRRSNDHISIRAEKLIIGLGERAIPQLLEILELKDDNNNAAHQMIWKIGSNGIPTLERVLYDPTKSKSVKENVLHILKESHIPEAHAALEKWQREQGDKK